MGGCLFGEPFQHCNDENSCKKIPSCGRLITAEKDVTNHAFFLHMLEKESRHGSRRENQLLPSSYYYYYYYY
jgi:hypothetical protein